MRTFFNWDRKREFDFLPAIVWCLIVDAIDIIPFMFGAAMWVALGWLPLIPQTLLSPIIDYFFTFLQTGIMLILFKDKRIGWVNLDILINWIPAGGLILDLFPSYTFLYLLDQMGGAKPILRLFEPFIDFMYGVVDRLHGLERMIR